MLRIHRISKLVISVISSIATISQTGNSKININIYVLVWLVVMDNEKQHHEIQYSQ